MRIVTCSVDGCDRTDRITRGMCSKHHQRLIKTGTTDDPYPTGVACSVDDCERTDKLRRGLCFAHYRRLLRTGSTNPTPLRDKPRERPRHCTMDGCAAPLYARGWCKDHYRYHWQFEQRVARAVARGVPARRLLDPSLKTCPTCTGQFPLTYYPPSKVQSQSWGCHPCAQTRLKAERAADPQRFADYRLNAYRNRGGRYRAHKTTKVAMAALLAEQGGLCPVCADPIDLADTRKTAIDHDHSCCPGTYSCGKCIRGILHHRCNVLVGHMELNLDHIERALRYIVGGPAACLEPPTRVVG